jgi:hypothetical protein
MLQRGDAVPHFRVRTVDRQVFDYGIIWQRRSLALVILPAAGVDDFPGESGDAEDSSHSRHDEGYVREVMSRRAEFDARGSACVITRDDVAGLIPPAALVADRWGEVVFVAGVATAEMLPAPEELLEWLAYLENRCPECEGEAR